MGWIQVITKKSEESNMFINSELIKSIRWEIAPDNSTRVIDYYVNLDNNSDKNEYYILSYNITQTEWELTIRQKERWAREQHFPDSDYLKKLGEIVKNTIAREKLEKIFLHILQSDNKQIIDLSKL